MQGIAVGRSVGPPEATCQAWPHSMASASVSPARHGLRAWPQHPLPARARAVGRPRGAQAAPDAASEAGTSVSLRAWEHSASPVCPCLVGRRGPLLGISAFSDSGRHPEGRRGPLHPSAGHGPSAGHRRYPCPRAVHRGHPPGRCGATTRRSSPCACCVRVACVRVACVVRACVRVRARACVRVRVLGGGQVSADRQGLVRKQQQRARDTGQLEKNLRDARENMHHTMRQVLSALVSTSQHAPHDAAGAGDTRCPSLGPHAPLDAAPGLHAPRADSPASSECDSPQSPKQDP